MNRTSTPILLLCSWLCALMGCNLVTIYGEAKPDQGMLSLDMSPELDAARDADLSPTEPEMGDLGELDLAVVPGDASPDLQDADDMGPPLVDMPVDMMGAEEMGPALFDPRVEPMHLLFIGNSFTFQGPVPTHVERLASSAGWPMPYVNFVAPGGKSLAFHRQNSDTLDAIDAGGWHAVILQDFSTRPTDAAGDPDGFKEDALWLFERVQASSPGARVVLYMTWARHPDHGIYPGTFTDPDQMQDQLALHYHDAANRFIPEGSMIPDAASLVEVAPVGEVWRHQLASDSPLRLHDSDDYHANAHGRWLNAMTIYASLYRRNTEGLPLDELPTAIMEQLSSSVDEVHPQALSGGPDGVPFAPPPGPAPFEVGDRIRIDFGPAASATNLDGWNNVALDTTRLDVLANDEGSPTFLALEVTSPFSGANNTGAMSNGFGYPPSSVADSLWSGELGGTHAEALLVQGRVKLTGLDAQGAYRITIFASRTNPDGMMGRLGRYQIGSQFEDFDATDNTESRVVFERVEPDMTGAIELTVNVSPDGSSRYAYLNVLELERVE